MTASFRYVWIQDAADHWTFRVEPEDWTPPQPEEMTLERIRELAGEVPPDVSVRFDGEGSFHVAPPPAQPRPATSCTETDHPRHASRRKRGRRRGPKGQSAEKETRDANDS
jgi:hypothetical protein